MHLRIMYKSQCKLNWIPLHSTDQLQEIANKEESTFAIFKHSTRCPISSAAKNRMEQSWEEENPEIPVYLVDVIEHRDVSDQIAEHFSVTHQSPQILLIKNDGCVYNASHTGISPTTVATHK